MVVPVRRGEGAENGFLETETGEEQVYLPFELRSVMAEEGGPVESCK